MPAGVEPRKRAEMTIEGGEGHEAGGALRDHGGAVRDQGEALRGRCAAEEAQTHPLLTCWRTCSPT